MSELSIRERVQRISAEMFGQTPTPHELSEYEVALAGLISPLGEAVCHAEIAFRQAVLSAEGTSAAGKRQIAEAGPEYARLLHAKADLNAADQMLKTCRSAIRLKTEELRMTR